MIGYYKRQQGGGNIEETNGDKGRHIRCEDLRGVSPGL